MKQKRKVFFTIGGYLTATEQKVGLRRFTKKTANRGSHVIQ